MFCYLQVYFFFLFPLRSGALGKVFGGYGIFLISVGRLGMASWVGLARFGRLGWIGLGGFGLAWLDGGGSML